MKWTSIRKIADAIKNDVNSGLRGYHTNMSMSIEQLEREVVDMRLAVIKEYMMKGILPIHDLLMSINCVEADCKGLDKCPCNRELCGEDPKIHFEIPLLLFDYGLKKAIFYIGSTDKEHPFLVYTGSLNTIKHYHKYRKRGKNKPWVYIDVTPNSNGKLDCYVFGAPLLKIVSVVGIFKDPRLLEEYQCYCDSTSESNETDDNFNFIDTTVKERLTKLKLYYYRQLLAPILPNNQEYAAG